MDTRFAAILCAVISILVTPSGSQVALAADCGEPVPAPKYQVGDKWVSRNEKGVESIREVVSFEGDLAKVRWSNPSMEPDKEGTILIDSDGVIRKAIRSNGEVVTAQGVGRPYDLIGQRELGFPLQVGKKWSFTYRTAGGNTGWRNYRVVACEEVSTPAGKFPALRIENEIRVPRWSGTYHFWYAPAVKASIKWKFPGGFDRTAQDSELIKYELK
jgi:hypothetical protein